MPGAHVFRASRLSRGNLLFPDPGGGDRNCSVVHFTPEWSGAREQSMHLAHVASVAIDRNLFFADVMIESSGGASPVRCHGHRKADAIEMKRLIEQFQSDYYRARGGRRRHGRGPAPGMTSENAGSSAPAGSGRSRDPVPRARPVAASRRAAAVSLCPRPTSRSKSSR